MEKVKYPIQNDIPALSQSDIVNLPLGWANIIQFRIMYNTDYLITNNVVELVIICFFQNDLVCHAELNAILNKNSADVKGCRLYVGLFPCNECAKLIIQSGIKEVLYVSDKYHNNEEMVASRTLLDMTGVKYRSVYLIV